MRVLNLESNDITSIAGLSSSRELKELHLSKNKIRQFEPPPGLSLPNLVLLKVDDNSLRSLANFFSLPRLQALDLSNNRLADMEEIERLHLVLPILQEMCIQNNPVTKRHLARSTIIFRYPFSSEQCVYMVTVAPPMQSSSKTSVKLTAMSFDSLTGSQRRKSANPSNNGVTLLPQVPQSLQSPMSSTRDEKDKARDSVDSKEDRRKVLPDTLVSSTIYFNSMVVKYLIL
ncbi:hypothetical protein DYB35_008760 [Aphanomyces astaci]|uniref:U2A'/phosphoprotein 32 family A C-terminal domain-containing protein n=1 Tax=Aphanomyces astaci TaxID=112090 RepID=A0A418D1V8_APHAT|nr:hypothetical protein DYB35_008760 [Aphanomyces astaci]